MTAAKICATVTGRIMCDYVGKNSSPLDHPGAARRVLARRSGRLRRRPRTIESGAPGSARRSARPVRVPVARAARSGAGALHPRLRPSRRSATEPRGLPGNHPRRGTLAMGLYLVTGGAGFIGSSIARALIARGDACASSTTSRPASARTWPTSRTRSSSSRATSATTCMLARATGGVEVVFHEAAIASVPRRWPSRWRTTPSTPPARCACWRRAPRRRAAGGLRRVVGGLRRRARPAQGRDHAAGAALALRRDEAGGRGGDAGVRARLRPRDRLPALLQRVRPAPGSEVGVRGGDPELHHRGAGGEAAAHLRRRRSSRATSATSTTSSRRTSRRRRPTARRRVGRRVQHRLRRGRSISTRRGADRRRPGAASSRRVYEPARAGDIKHSLGRHRRGARRAGLPRARVVRRGLRRTIEWYKSQIVNQHDGLRPRLSRGGRAPAARRDPLGQPPRPRSQGPRPESDAYCEAEIGAGGARRRRARRGHGARARGVARAARRRRRGRGSARRTPRSSSCGRSWGSPSRSAWRPSPRS